MKGIGMTYFHKMSIERMTETVDEFGGTNQEYKPVDGLQGIVCGFSQSNRSGKNTTQTTSVNLIEYNPKIFCNPEIEIKAGDRITVSFKARTLGTFTASEPYLYETHQEIPIYKQGEA